MAADPTIAVLDYGIGNLHSAQKGFDHVGATTHLTADRGLIADADGVVLPGVGSFGPTMTALHRTGLDEVVHEVVSTGRPFLGICIGMQVLFASSEEAPGCAGLGVIDREVRFLPATVKRPQMQWNVVDASPGHPMFSGLSNAPWMYFVHSLAADPGADVVATCRYGGDVVAAVADDRLWAVQFHPEKSGPAGLRVLANFVASCRSGRGS